MELKVLYIPTAMYAIRADSENTPGKQRQRARADGKKKRDQVVQYIQEMFSASPVGENLNILAVTLDLDDGSIKQPTSTGSADSKSFPKEGKQALTGWNPHVIYLEGGNTFWLHHCMEKGEEDWFQLIKDACCCCTSTIKDDSDRRPALYIGKSAGAIVAGKYVETATWKGWDDPSCVPGKESYDDWKGASPSFGFNLVGDASVFPHMSENWQDLVDEKRDSLPQDSDLYCLREFDACCVEGSIKDVFIS